jgi:soluble lytic murein transglycosylase-like protein
MYYMVVACLLFSANIEAKVSDATVIKHAKSIGRKYGIDPALLYAIAKVESNFNERAVGSSHGEIGLMQLRPTFFPTATFEPRQNMELAAKHLKKLKKQCANMGPAWFVCYNVGASRKLTDPKRSPYYKKVTYAQRQYNRASPARRVASNADQR